MSAIRTTGPVALALVFALAVAAAGSASTERDSLPTHFAGFPPEGVKASTPTTGRLLLGLRPTATQQIWNVYADGRIIWQKWTSSGDATVVPGGARRLDTGYVQQRLTLKGVQLLRSKLLATGLFEHNLRLDVGRYNAWVFHQVRRGDRLVTVDGVPSPDPSWKEHFTKATPAQTQALASIEKFVADPARWLPARAWADRRIRAFVPARYVLVFDRGYPDLSKLPAPAGKALVQFKQLKRHGCQIVTTGQARALASGVREGWDIALGEQWRRLSPSTSPACTSLTPRTSICTLHFQTLAAEPAGVLHRLDMARMPSRVPLTVEDRHASRRRADFRRGAGGGCRPRRDSNPRYSLERAVTWAASRRGPGPRIAPTGQRPTPLAADAEIGGDDRRGQPPVHARTGTDVHSTDADLPPARTKQDAAMRRAVHPELDRHLRAHARRGPGEVLAHAPEAATVAPGTSTRPAARTASRPGTSARSSRALPSRANGPGPPPRGPNRVPAHLGRTAAGAR